MSNRATTVAITTCQICAREIKANTGMITHHGYQRPGNGWQTASCMGAKHLPYEQSRDLIPSVIEQYKDLRQDNIEREAELIDNPPATLEGTPARNGESVTYNRPDDFNAKDNVDPEGYHSYRADGYSRMHYSQVRQCRSNIKDITFEIERLQRRYDEWRAA